MNYEPRDASLPVIGVCAGILAGLVAGSIGVSTWLYHARYTDLHAVRSVLRQTSFKDGAHVKLGITQDYDAMLRDSDAHLRGYGWVDRGAGVGRVPIERAMQLLVAGVKPAEAPKEPGQVP